MEKDKINLKKNLVFGKDREGSLVIFDYDEGKLIKFNSTGEFLINCIREGMIEEEIIKKMENEFKIEKETIERDFSLFRSGLQNNKLIGSF